MAKPLAKNSTSNKAQAARPAQAEVVPTMPVGEISVMLSEVDAGVNMLTAAIADLQLRLAPVLSDPRISPAQQGASPKAKSSLAQSLEDLNNRVEHARLMVTHLTSSVEL